MTAEQRVEPLVDALGGVTYEDLLDDLVRYGMRPADEWRALHPVLSDEMVREALAASDECAVCCRRFVSVPGVRHVDGCALAAALRSPPKSTS